MNRIFFDSWVVLCLYTYHEQRGVVRCSLRVQHELVDCHCLERSIKKDNFNPILISLLVLKSKVCTWAISAAASKKIGNNSIVIISCIGVERRTLKCVFKTRYRLPFYNAIRLRHMDCRPLNSIFLANAIIDKLAISFPLDRSSAYDFRRAVPLLWSCCVKKSY